MKRFDHDCSACHFLGQEGRYDLYFCDAFSDMPTVIARWGNEPHEYGSGMFAADLGAEPYAEAKRRATKKGLLGKKPFWKHWWPWRKE